MIRGARATMEQAPWLLFWPCLALAGTILTINLLCDACAMPSIRAPDRLVAVCSGARRCACCRMPRRAGAIAVARRRPHHRDRDGVGAHSARDVSLSIKPGETLALVGESGSGKTLTGLALLGLLPPSMEIIGAGCCSSTGQGNT